MSNLHFETITEDMRLLLDAIQTDDNFQEFYLAGGTALSLQIGHRKSVDLDFFTDKEFAYNLIDKFSFKYEALNITNNSIEIITKNTKVMFLYFAYPLQQDVIKVGNIKLASPLDIGLMKLLALQGRTTKKDIYDLFFIDQIISLEKLLALFDKTYPKDAFNNYASFKALLDVEELDKQPDVVVLQDVEWDDVLQFVKGKIIKYLGQEVGVV